MQCWTILSGSRTDVQCTIVTKCREDSKRVFMYQAIILDELVQHVQRNSHMLGCKLLPLSILYKMCFSMSITNMVQQCQI